MTDEGYGTAHTTATKDSSATRRRQPPNPTLANSSEKLDQPTSPIQTPAHTTPPIPKTGQPLYPSLPNEHAHRNPTIKLWLQSRLLPSSSSGTKFRPKGEDRPVTQHNIKLAFGLLVLVWTRFLGLFWGAYKLRVVGFLAGRMVKGVLPAARIWASSRMLDMVQTSFESKVADRGEVLRVAAMSMLLTAGDDIFNYICSDNDLFVKTHLNYTMEKSYLRAQLSLSIPSLSSPFLSALMYEAGVFAGFEARITPYGPRSGSGGPFQTLSSTFSALTITIEVISQAFLLVKTLASVPGNTDLNSSSLILITLSFAPSLLRMAGMWLGPTKRRKTGKDRLDWHKSRQQEIAIKDMGRNGGYKQEVVLYGLKEWVLSKWEDLKIKQLEEQQKNRQNARLLELGLGLGQEGVQTAFYVLLALRALNTSLSLGSIRLYQSTASSLLRSVQSFTGVLGETFQSIFFLAAFLEAIDDPEKHEIIYRRGLSGDSLTELVDYESVRIEGGMKIEAKNLSFTYPGSEQPVLRNVNLIVNPGETLAIVGFNGGGKSTLVKILMGLYDHNGTLLINDRAAKEFSPDSLHRRTSCLFQDFSRYTLTLRENVGVGQVEEIDDRDRIMEAVKKGGAEGVLEKVGMEGWLNRSGVPDISGGEDMPGNSGEDTSVTMGTNMGLPPGGPPPGMKPPGGGGKGGRSGGGRSLLGEGDTGGRGRGPPKDMPFPPPGMGPPPDGMPPPEMMGMMMKSTKKIDSHTALSGGQWQRVALSRAFLRSEQADLVVFDEPSASLDPRAEAELFHRIHALSHQNGRKTTTIYISHRFSTVRRADKIAVVEEGTISEIGSHEALMGLKGRYFELFNLQKEGFA